MIELSALVITILAACILAFMFNRKASEKPASKTPESISPASMPEIDAIAQAEPAIAPEAVRAVDHVLSAAHMPGRTVDLPAVLRDLDAVFPQIAIRPDTSIEEVQFNAGQRSLADWMRQQYLARGKQAGSMSKPLSI